MAINALTVTLTWLEWCKFGELGPLTAEFMRVIKAYRIIDYQFSYICLLVPVLDTSKSLPRFLSSIR